MNKFESLLLDSFPLINDLIEHLEFLEEEIENSNVNPAAWRHLKDTLPIYYEKFNDLKEKYIKEEKSKNTLNQRNTNGNNI